MIRPAEEIRALARENRRPNAIDAEWEEREPERKWRALAKLASGTARALSEVLRDADVELARYACWLALPVCTREDVDLDAIADPDARLIACALVLGHEQACPPWLRERITRALEQAPRASRNLEATIDVLRKAAAEPERFTPANALAHGARLFNAGKYFEAHDAWEDLWRFLRSPERDFFRGLINLAVALKKAHEGNPKGLQRLLDRADGMLAPYAPTHRGIDIADLRARITGLREQADETSDGWRFAIDPKDIPKLPE